MIYRIFCEGQPEDYVETDGVIKSTLWEFYYSVRSWCRRDPRRTWNIAYVPGQWELTKELLEGHFGYKL